MLSPHTSAQDVKHLSPNIGPTAHLPVHHAGFTAWRQGDDTIRFFDGATVQDLMVNAAGVGDPHIDNGVVTWEAKVSIGGTLYDEIFYYDVSQGGAPIQITSTAYDNNSPRVWRTEPIGTQGDFYIAWRGDDPADADIFYYHYFGNGSTPTTTRVVRAGDDMPHFADLSVNSLDIEDDFITWQGKDPQHGSELDIYLTDLKNAWTIPGTAYALSEAYETTAGTQEEDWEPQTAAGFIVWRRGKRFDNPTVRIVSFDSPASAPPFTPVFHDLQVLSSSTNRFWRPMIDALPGSGSAVGTVAWVNEAFAPSAQNLEGRLSIAPGPSNPLVTITSNTKIDDRLFVKDNVVYWQRQGTGGLTMPPRVYRQWDFLNPSAPAANHAIDPNQPTVGFTLVDRNSGNPMNENLYWTDSAASAGDSAVALRILQQGGGVGKYQVALRSPASLVARAGTNPGEVIFDVTSSYWNDAPAGQNAIFRVFLSRKGGAIYNLDGFLGSSGCNTPLAWGGEYVGYPDNSTPDGSFRKMSIDGFDFGTGIADLLYTWSQHTNGGNGIQGTMGAFTGGVTSGSSASTSITPAVSGETAYASAWIAVQDSGTGAWDIRSITPTICFIAP